MQFREVLLKSVSALALVGLVAGAVPAVAQNSNPEAAKALGEIKGEIRFSWWGGQVRSDKTDKILQLFEQENPGVKVGRENADFVPHTATARDGAWDSKSIDGSSAWRTVASAAGRHQYYCVFHPTMKAAVVVQ